LREFGLLKGFFETGGEFSGVCCAEVEVSLGPEEKETKGVSCCWLVGRF
jgi:hypothetical protein